MNIFDRKHAQKPKSATIKNEDGWHIPVDLLDLKNSDRNVSLKNALESNEMKAATSPLSFPIGKDAKGKFLIANFHDLPHIMAGGQTGSGKSSFTEGTIILSLIYRNSPDDLKFILIDPKQVQFTQYNGVPHLLRPVIEDLDEAKNAIEWLLQEMADRFDILANSQMMNIVDYNRSKKGHMPYIILIIDEVSDLMMIDGKFYQKAFISLLQKARAVGIQMYIGTSRPSPDVLPGLLKANFPTRIAFTTSSSLDSRRLLDTNGAETLSGHGDLLLSTSDNPRPVRLQAPYVSDEEQARVVEYIQNI
jgi:S-DNA-T family DNA segregation ATPase FtsK/SpoIIIE